jgi:hypothetical protein
MPCGIVSSDWVRFVSDLAPGVGINVGPIHAVSVPSGNFDEQAKAALFAEAQDHVRPMRITARRVADGFAADLVAVDGSVAVADYGAGPDELLAVLVAEQRYLVEQVGRGSIRGATYLDKARERVRRGFESRS